MPKETMEEQFDKQFPENSMVYDGGSKGEFGYQENHRQRLKSFLSTSIAQAIAEERERVVGEIKKPLEIVADFVERWNKQDKEKDVAQAIEDLLSIKNKQI